jgi:hypothetical protein
MKKILIIEDDQIVGDIYRNKLAVGASRWRLPETD